jgi:thiamine biosynthesis lipoprotein
MGSPFNILIYSSDSLAAANAAAEAFTYIDTLNQVYSDYLPNSELNLLCASSGSGEWFNTSETLFAIVKYAVECARLSGGSFDISAGPVTRLWRTARKNKTLPHKESINAALQRVGNRLIQLDTIGKRVKLLQAGMQLDLGGIAKGETAQRTVDKLRTMGFSQVLVDAGGDIVVADVPPGVSGWKVAVNLPEQEEWMERRLLLRCKAVTTSGDLYQYVEVGGKRYSHIVDPRTGWAITNSRNVTVIANEGLTADWLTKACTILPVDEALALVAKFQGAEVQIGQLENDKPVFYRSPGFEQCFEKER